MQLSKLRDKNTIEISKESAIKSREFMNNLLSMLSAKYAKMQTSDWLSINLAKLSRILDGCSEKQIERQVLITRMHLTSKQLTDILTTARDCEMITIAGSKPQIITLRKTYDEVKAESKNKENQPITETSSDIIIPIEQLGLGAALVEPQSVPQPLK